MSVLTDYEAAVAAVEAAQDTAEAALDPVANSGYDNGIYAKVAQSCAEALASLKGGAGQLSQLDNKLHHL
jgi:hypothetical protein